MLDKEQFDKEGKTSRQIIREAIEGPLLDDYTKAFNAHILDEIEKGFTEKKVRMFEQVIEMILGRKAEAEDMKDFCLVNKAGYDYDVLTYKGEAMGAFTTGSEYTPEKGFMMTYTFEPNIKTFR